MAEPIKNRRLNDLAGAPTPQNTPATASSSFAARVSGPRVSTIKEEEGGLGGLANNPALLSMIQGKLGSLVGKSSGYIDSLPQLVRDRISGLKGVQAEQAKLEAKFQEELLELEKKYFALYEPLYARRSKIVSGEQEPTEEEVTVGKELDEGDDEEDDEEEKAEKEEEEEEAEDKDIKGIPEFWLTAMKNLLSVSETITEEDEEALKYVKDIRMQYLNKPGFALVFEFSENPFFTNKSLRKTYFYQEETGYGGDFIYDHAEGDEINWISPEKNLTIKVEKRKQRNKHTKATRTIEKTLPVDSFFNFFSPPKAPSGDGEEVEEVTEDLEERLEIDYQLGEEIKEKLIPRAVDWYTGEALQYEDLNDYEEDYDDEEDDEDDEDDDDDDDDDDDEEEEGDDGNAAKVDKPGECNQS
jgi:nucleosome assembly protein 1-like 1